MMEEKSLTLIENNLNHLLERKAMSLPRDFNQTRFIQNCSSVLGDLVGIENIEPHSIVKTMAKGAFLGLDFFMKECYAIPYNKNIGTKDKPKYVKELNFQTDYKGEIKLAKKYSKEKIKNIYAKIVRDGDAFEEKIYHGEQTINYKPKPFNDGEIIGVFAVCVFQNGSMIYETMNIDEVRHIRDVYSKVPKGKAWGDSEGEMTKKTCLRRLCKLIQYDFDSHEQEESYVESGGFEFENAEFKDLKQIKKSKPEVTQPEEIKPEVDKPKEKKKTDLISKEQSEEIGKIMTAKKMPVEEGLSILDKFKYKKRSEITIGDFAEIKRQIERWEKKEEGQTKISLGGADASPDN